jgi:hypothetical protein
MIFGFGSAIFMEQPKSGVSLASALVDARRQQKHRELEEMEEVSTFCFPASIGMSFVLKLHICCRRTRNGSLSTLITDISLVCALEY